MNVGRVLVLNNDPAVYPKPNVPVGISTESDVAMLTTSLKQSHTPEQGLEDVPPQIKGCQTSQTGIGLSNRDQTIGSAVARLLS